MLRSRPALSAHDHAGADPLGHPEHISPYWVYFAVAGGLFCLTALTVGVSELGLPMPYSLIAAMIIAVTKAGLVVAFFMHMIHDTRLNLLVLTAGVFFSLVFITLTMTDVLSRGMVDPMNDPQWTLQQTLSAGEVPPGWAVADPDYDPNAKHEAGASEHPAAEGAAAGDHGGEAKP